MVFDSVAIIDIKAVYTVACLSRMIRTCKLCMLREKVLDTHLDCLRLSGYQVPLYHTQPALYVCRHTW